MADRFELRRQCDGLIYSFARAKTANGAWGFRRADADLWILYHDQLGWIAADQDDLETPAPKVYGRPWDQPPPHARDLPPQGIWVSRKGAKSYVYDLVHL